MPSWPPGPETKIVLEKDNGDKHEFLKVWQDAEDNDIFLQTLLHEPKLEVKTEDRGIDEVISPDHFHLSVHASGQVHIRRVDEGDRRIVESFQIPELENLRDPVKLATFQPVAVDHYPQVQEVGDEDMTLASGEIDFERRFEAQLFVGPSEDELRDMYHVESRMNDEVERLLPIPGEFWRQRGMLFERYSLSFMLVLIQTPELAVYSHITFERWLLNVLEEPSEYEEQMEEAELPEEMEMDLDVDS